MRKLLLVVVALLASLLIAACGTGAPAYPNKAITFLVPYTPGQGPDVASRYLAAELEKDLGQKVQIENNAGGGTSIATAQLAAAKPDGYTIGWVSPWSVDYLPMTEDTPFKGIVDFTPISGVHQSNGGIFVKADSPYKTLQDLFDDAKKKGPGKVKMGTVGGLKGLGHIKVLQIAKAGGVEFNVIPVNTSTVADLLGGTLDVGYDGTTSAVPQIVAGKLRALIVGYAVPELKGVPVPGDLKLEMVASTGAVMGPKGIPADIVAKLDASFKKTVQSEAFLEAEKKLGVSPLYMTPEEIVSRAKSDAASLRLIATEQGWLKK